MTVFSSRILAVAVVGLLGLPNQPMAQQPQLSNSTNSTNSTKPICLIVPFPCARTGEPVFTRQRLPHG